VVPDLGSNGDAEGLRLSELVVVPPGGFACGTAETVPAVNQQQPPWELLQFLDERLGPGADPRRERGQIGHGPTPLVFHRAVAFDRSGRPQPAGGIHGRLLVNGRTRASAPVPAAGELADRVGAAAQLLGVMGEWLEAGDRIITGSVVQAARSRRLTL
jgi:hypothetical protein